MSQQNSFSRNKFNSKGRSFGQKKFGDGMNCSDSLMDKVQSHNSFFIKPSKHNFRSKIENKFESNGDFGFKQYKINQKIRPNKNKIKETDETSSYSQEKRPFDKKLYRLKKYSNKFKVQQWEEKRKKGALRYLKRTQKMDESEKKLDVQKIYDEFKEDLDENSDNEKKDNVISTEAIANQGTPIVNVAEQRSLADKFEKQELRKTKKGFKRKYEDVKAEKEAQREEYLKKKQEKEEALKAYKKKKIENYKKLSMKTKKGQPVMKGRMELLLEQIQNSMNSD